jgi:hypothetical protein
MNPFIELYRRYASAVSSALDSPALCVFIAGLVLCGFGFGVGLSVVHDISSGTRSWDSPTYVSTTYRNINHYTEPLWVTGMFAVIFLILGLGALLWLLAERLGWLNRFPMLRLYIFKNR